jgi:hypothetical protein
MATRVNIRVSDEDYRLLKEWGARLGITMSQLGGMSTHTGLKALLRVIEPEAAFDPAFIAAIVDEMHKDDAKVRDVS